MKIVRDILYFMFAMVIFGLSMALLVTVVLLVWTVCHAVVVSLF